MPVWVPTTGGTLFIASGPDGDHLFVLVYSRVLDGHGPENQFLLVPFCSVDGARYCDEACIVRAGEHPFIKNVSYLSYRDAQLQTSAHLENLVNKGIYRPHDQVTDELLKKIRTGLTVSSRTKNFIKLVSW